MTKYKTIIVRSRLEVDLLIYLFLLIPKAVSQEPWSFMERLSKKGINMMAIAQRWMTRLSRLQLHSLLFRIQSFHSLSLDRFLSLSLPHTYKHKPKGLSNYPWNNLLDWYLNYTLPFLCVILSHTHTLLLSPFSTVQWMHRGGMRWPCFFIFFLVEPLSTVLYLSDVLSCFVLVFFFSCTWYFIDFIFHLNVCWIKMEGLSKKKKSFRKLLWFLWFYDSEWNSAETSLRIVSLTRFPKSSESHQR